MCNVSKAVQLGNSRDQAASKSSVCSRNSGSGWEPRAEKVPWDGSCGFPSQHGQGRAVIMVAVVWRPHLHRAPLDARGTWPWQCEAETEWLTKVRGSGGGGGGGGVVLAHSLRAQPFVAGESWQQDQEGWSHCICSQAAAGNAGAQLPFSLCAAELWDGAVHVQGGLCFPSTQSRSPSDTPRGSFPW